MPKRGVATESQVEEEPVAVEDEEEENLLPESPVQFNQLPGADDLDDEVSETALATTDDYSSGVTRSSAGGSAMRFDSNPDFEQSEIDIPRLRLIQGISNEVSEGIAKPGQWVLPGHPAMDAVTFIPAGMMRNRELRNKERMVQCASSDAMIGKGNPGGACSTCPMAEWVPRNDGSGKNFPPPCSLIYVYLGYVPEVDELCVVKFQKTQIDAAKWFNSMATTRGGFGRFGVTLESLKKQGNGATYFVPKTSLAQVPPAMLSKAVSLALPG